MRRASVLVLVVSLWVGVLTAFAVSPAAAVGAVITSPAPDQQVEWGTSSFTVEVTEPGELQWEVRSDDGYYHDADYVTAEQTGPLVIAVDPVLHTGSYRIRLTDAEGVELTSSTFSTVSPPGLSEARVSPATIYPWFVDGYRDTTRFSFRTDRDLLGVSIAVFTADGDVVRRARLGARRAGEVRWRWDGRTGSGHLLVAGDYRIEATVRTDDRRTLAITSPTVTSATTARQERIRVERLGADPSSVTRSRGCRATRDRYDRLTLACRGAGDDAVARATYDFRLPAGPPGTHPRDLRWRVDGRSGTGGTGGTGDVRITGRKVSERLFRVEVRVTGDRAYVVRSAVLAYTAYVGR